MKKQTQLSEKYETQPSETYKTQPSETKYTTTTQVKQNETTTQVKQNTTTTKVKKCNNSKSETNQVKICVVNNIKCNKSSENFDYSAREECVQTPLKTCYERTHGTGD